MPCRVNTVKPPRETEPGARIGLPALLSRECWGFGAREVDAATAVGALGELLGELPLGEDAVLVRDESQALQLGRPRQEVQDRVLDEEVAVDLEHLPLIRSVLV